MAETYTKAEVEALFGKDVLPKSTIQLYTDRKVVKPAVVPKRRGLPRKYSVKNLVELLLCRKMVDIGFTIDQVGHVIQGIGLDDVLESNSKITDSATIALYVAYTKNDKVMVSVKIQKGQGQDIIKVDMTDNIHVRIINISEIFRTVIKAI